MTAGEWFGFIIGLLFIVFVLLPIVFIAIAFFLMFFIIPVVGSVLHLIAG
jgi:hypothetical protein